MEYDTTENSVGGLEKALFDQEKLRRKLHNKIQDLKGNIRVFCRVRHGKCVLNMFMINQLNVR